MKRYIPSDDFMSLAVMSVPCGPWSKQALLVDSLGAIERLWEAHRGSPWGARGLFVRRHAPPPCYPRYFLAGVLGPVWWRMGNEKNAPFKSVE